MCVGKRGSIGRGMSVFILLAVLFSSTATTAKMSRYLMSSLKIWLGGFQEMRKQVGNIC